MGLDQYLYVNSKRVCQEVNDNDRQRDFLAPRGIAIQWRKANAIHRWFVDNVQDGKDDCGIYEVDVEQLCKLHDTCKAVLDSTELVDAEIDESERFLNGRWTRSTIDGKKLADPTVAKELLPTQDGFFFGSTAYDQWYWWDLEFTMGKIDAILRNLVPADEYGFHVAHRSEPDWYVRFYYRSSW